MRPTPLPRTVLCLAAALALLAGGGPCRGDDAPDFSRWEKDIAAFEKRDAETPPPRDGVLFAGSSSIRLLDLKKSFPNLDAVNRGFGGSQIADSTHFAPRIILPLRPRLIVFYAGDNDIAAGKTPERVADDFRAFAALIHKELPKTRIVFISIKPSLARRDQVDRQQAANALIEKICKDHDFLAYLDAATPMLGDDGKPKKDLFRDDGLHLNDKGYALWISLLKPLIPAADGSAGWRKSDKNPVLGGDLGTCFDVSVLRDGHKYRMWFSWRPKQSIALVESDDGLSWGEPTIVLGPDKATGWEDDVNRPVVIKDGDGYRMWYTGQAKGKSWIGCATSDDGKEWKRAAHKPVLSAEKPWEGQAVMCPHVLYDADKKLYRMWYSGGEQFEPNAIGYATSTDGLKWDKDERNPIFQPEQKNAWEKDRVTACQVVEQGDWYVMFYIGFADREHAQIGLARSKNGVTGWERHPANPIIRPGKGQWDANAVYKPYAIYDGKRWLLWYNGRRGGVEQIGVAIHDGEDLGF